MKSKHKTSALLIFVVLLAFLDGILVMNHFSGTSTSAMVNKVRQLSDKLEIKSTAEGTTPETEKTLAFTTQAPIGYWTEAPWADFAEEACVYMAYKWGGNTEMPDKYDVAANLKAIGEWENEHFGSSALTDMNQTLQMLTLALGYTKATLVSELNEAKLKLELDAGGIWIVPVNGQILANPYYGDPAPEHHMIVIYDYNDQGFLANDPGTRRGAAFVYTTTKILESIQDLNGEQRAILVNR